MEDQSEVAVEAELSRQLLALEAALVDLRARAGSVFSVRESVSAKSRLVELENLRRDVAKAEEAAEQEEAEEQADLLVLRSTGELRRGVENCQSLIAGIAENDKERAKAEEDAVRLQFLFEARQVKLLSELQTIYPIERVVGTGGDKDKVRFAIRGIEFQSPFEGSQRDDEQISTVLGYIVHLSLLVSKYLEIPLRYQLLFFASRSIIRDPVQKDPKEQNLPLYRKDVEPERFRRAMQWLTRDVEQLLAARDVAYAPNKDLLYNLSRLFRSEMDPLGSFSSSE